MTDWKRRFFFIMLSMLFVCYFYYVQDGRHIAIAQFLSPLVKVILGHFLPITQACMEKNWAYICLNSLELVTILVLTILPSSFTWSTKLAQSVFVMMHLAWEAFTRYLISLGRSSVVPGLSIMPSTKKNILYY